MYNKISDIVKKAGRIALNYFIDPRRQKPRLKEDFTIVTEADIASQEYITEKLSQLTPDYKIVGEETAGKLSKQDIEKLRDTRYIWAIDPVDGTASFSNNLPNWVVSLGLLEYGKPVAGWIYAPVWDQLYYTTPDDEFSYLNGDILPKKTDDKSTIDKNSSLMVDSKTFRKYSLRGYKGKIRSLGSTAFHITLVATSSVIGANSIRNKIWDIAGASAIADKCGIKLNYLSGEAVDYKELLNLNHTKEDIITCSEKLFPTIKSFFEPYQ